jgi:hypothetical protein
MEPLSGLSAAAVGAIVLAKTVRTARREYCKEVRLPEHLKELGIDSASQVPVAAIHIEQVEMASKFQGKDLSICVKYGGRAHSLKCSLARFTPQISRQPRFSRLVHSKPTSCVPTRLGASCLFLFNTHVDPFIWVSIYEAGLRGCASSVARATFLLKDMSKDGTVDLPLLCKLTGKELGRVRLTCQKCHVKAKDLSSILAEVGAGQQRDAYLIAGGAPMVVSGELVATGGGASGDSIDESDSSGGASPGMPDTPLVGLCIS